MYLTLKEEYSVDKNVWTQESWSKQVITDNKERNDSYCGVAGRQ